MSYDSHLCILLNKYFQVPESTRNHPTLVSSCSLLRYVLLSYATVIHISLQLPQMKDGCRLTLAAINDGIKNCCRDWGFPTPLPLEKRDCGFYDDECGRLLCPVGLDWEDEEYVQLIFNYSVQMNILIHQRGQSMQRAA